MRGEGAIKPLSCSQFFDSLVVFIFNSFKSCSQCCCSCNGDCCLSCGDCCCDGY